MSEVRGTVLIVDDDAGMRGALEGLVRSLGHSALSFASPEEFLLGERPHTPSCLLLDLKLPGQSGLELQKTLKERGIEIPTIFISGYGDIPSTVRAMKAGAEEFLEKPVKDEELILAIERALDRDLALRKEKDEASLLQERFSSLTTREREVLSLVVRGLLNKQIAAELGTTEITVKVHRGRMMRKMQAGSVAELVRMVSKL